jgi:hypothetical protein
LRVTVVAIALLLVIPRLDMVIPGKLSSTADG